jgi:hypothetical protein
VAPLTDLLSGFGVLKDHKDVFKSFKLAVPECAGGYITSVWVLFAKLIYDVGSAVPLIPVLLLSMDAETLAIPLVLNI